MIKSVSHIWDFPVGNEDVTLSIEIAAPQVGGSSFLNFNGKFVAGENISEPLGNGAALKGKKLTVNTTVTDVDSQSNLTQVIYSLNSISRTFKDTVDANNGTIGYNITINFI